ncbi:hypothetical protein [Variovorax sp. N23]|uniref:hypothetical protein n=1 Tax=Variovorax sp. N23 TaxID=2980555 RepID=UPI0021CAB882|nr:hypothetical protein [Variovorax sp. N23]MCU4119312.1 hypothetical protein [Variovorax sp. N23]
MTVCSLTDYAKRHGVSKPAVTKWKARGWVVFIGEDVDVEASDAMLAKYRKTPPSGPRKAVNRGVNRSLVNTTVNTVQLTVEEGDSPEVAAAKIIAFTGAEMTFDEARRVKENYLALLNKLQFEEKDGALVDLALAEQVLFEGARAARDAWLNFSSKIGPQLAADLGLEADKVTEALTAYVHKQIAELGEPEADFAAR